MSLYQTLSIVVYKGDPVDHYLLRHVGLFTKFSSGRNVYQQVTGAHGFFAYDEEWDTDPTQIGIFLRFIPVITTQISSDDDLTMCNRIRSTLVNNKDRSWNCQSWVGDGLEGLEKDDIISPGSTKKAVDEMVDTLLEADVQD